MKTYQTQMRLVYWEDALRREREQKQREEEAILAGINLEKMQYDLPGAVTTCANLTKTLFAKGYN